MKVQNKTHQQKNYFSKLNLSVFTLITITQCLVMAKSYTSQMGLDKIKSNLDVATANKEGSVKNVTVANSNVTEVQKTKTLTQKQKETVNNEILNNNANLKQVILKEKELMQLISTEEQKKATENKQLQELERLKAQIEQNQKQRSTLITEYKRQLGLVQEEKKSWKNREAELRSQETATIEAIKSLSQQEATLVTQRKNFEIEQKKWTTEAEKQEKISETYQGLKEN